MSELEMIILCVAYITGFSIITVGFLYKAANEQHFITMSDVWCAIFLGALFSPIFYIGLLLYPFANAGKIKIWRKKK